MRVAIVSGPRSDLPMGLELAERRLLEALRSNPSSVELDLRVVGRRRALRHARRVGARWIPVFEPGFRPPRWPTSTSCTSSASICRHHGAARSLRPCTISPIHYGDEGSLPPWIEERRSTRTPRSTPSEFTAGEIQQQLGVPRERIRVFGGLTGVRDHFWPSLSDSELAELGITPPLRPPLRRLHSKRKNVPLLLEAWAQVPSGTLVLAGLVELAREHVLRSARSLGARRGPRLPSLKSPCTSTADRCAADLTSTYELFRYSLSLQALAVGHARRRGVNSIHPEYLRRGGTPRWRQRRRPGSRSEADPLGPRALAETLRETGLRRVKEMTWRKAADAVRSADREAAPASTGLPFAEFP